MYVCLSVCLSVCMYVCMYVCICGVGLVKFVHVFAPSSRRFWGLGFRVSGWRFQQSHCRPGAKVFRRRVLLTPRFPW